jgi:hypothetical protein
MTQAKKPDSNGEWTGKPLGRGREYFLVFLLYLAASLALTWPSGWRMGSELPVGGDSWQNNWNLWWTARAIADPHLSLLDPISIPCFRCLFSAGFPSNESIIS